MKNFPLFLAPMEGVGDFPFLKAMASIGGFDWACTEFIRVPLNPHIPSLSKEYVAKVTDPIPLAAQLMGSDPEKMGEMARAIEARGAPRIDLNCGCPSNTVTGKGAGSSLLKTPELLHAVLKEMVKSVQVPVTAKLRSGFSDTSLFQENLLAAQEAGIAFLTLHPRTKEDGYGPPARWDLIAEAKRLLKIPVIGNGDVLCVADALRLVEQTRCDGVMIGRGAIANPWIFQEIQAHFEGRESIQREAKSFFDALLRHTAPDVPLKSRLAKLKQLVSFRLRGDERRPQYLSRNYESTQEMIDWILPLFSLEANKRVS